MSITLPKLPMLDLSRDNLYGYTTDQLRARDIEVARIVLEGVAAEIRKWGDESRAAKDEHVALFCQITAASVEKLEVKHG